MADPLLRLPDLIAVAIALAVALTVLRAAPRKAPNQFLGFFLLLIVGNLLAGYVRALYSTGEGYRLAERVALQFLLLDPALLLAFALVYPRRHPWLEARHAPLLLLAPALVFTALHLALPSLFLLPDQRLPGEPALDPSLLRTAVLLYMAVFYMASFGLLVRNYVRETSPVFRDQLALFVVGFGVAILPRMGLVVHEVMGPIHAPVSGTPLAFPVVVAEQAGPTLLLFLASFRWALERAPADRRGEVRRTFGLMGRLLGLIVAIWTVAAFGNVAPLGELGGLLGSLVFGVRWTVFGVVVGYALLKYQVLDVGLQVRRFAGWFTAGVLVAGLAAAAWLASAASADALAALGPGQLLALVALVALAPWVVQWGLQVGPRLAPQGSEVSGVGRRLNVYRATLEGAMQGLILPSSAEPELRALRRDLGITDEQHAVLLEVVARDAAGARSVPSWTGQGRLAGRYELGEVLGAGSSGRCRLARDALLGRTVVVKEVPRLGQESAALLGEARAAGRLNHPNIVTVHDVVETGPLGYLVMEHVEGGSLRDRLQRGPLARSEAVQVLDDVLAGLEAAHAHDIVHGDLKPENVLLTLDRRAKLADFGSAFKAASSATMASLPSKAGPGTLLYLAPEEIRGDAPTMASDRYAVAAVGYELLGHRPYLELRGRGDFDVREAILREAPLPLDETVPEPLRAWLERGLAKEPGARWADAAEMRSALRLAAAKALA